MENNTQTTPAGLFLKTNIYKGYYGWTAETRTQPDENGGQWQINTMKRNRGGVYCSAVKGESKNGLFSYMPIGCEKLDLGGAEGQCNEKKIREVHAAGLIAFEAAIKEKTAAAPLYKIEIGQIFFTDFQGGKEARRAVAEVLPGGQYWTVLLDGTGVKIDDHVRNYAEKFGIGVYYNEGEKITPEEVRALWTAAENYKAEQAIIKAEEKTKAAAKRAEKLAAGAKVINEIPTNAAAVIVAELRENDSDPQTDYFNYTTKEVVYLAFSTHTRDLFPEMRTAAAKFTETAQLGPGMGVFTPFVKIGEDFQSNGSYYRAGERSHWHNDMLPTGHFCTEADAENYINERGAPGSMNIDGQKVSFYWDMSTKETEHREKYSMGAGYYLGESKYSGWIIKKISLSDDLKQRGGMLENLQIAAAENRYFIGTEAAEDTHTPTAAAVTVEADEIKVIDYSEKAIAVIGNTKPIKDKLSAAGGKFNPRLTCGPGWIFSKKRIEQVKAVLMEATAPQVQTNAAEDTHTQEPAPAEEQRSAPEQMEQEPAAEIIHTAKLRGGVVVLADPSGHPITYCNNTQARQREILETARGRSVAVYHPPFNQVVRYIQITL